MATTVRAAALDLLSYLRPIQRSLPPNATVDNPLSSVLAALNSAMAQLAMLGPAWCVHATRSIVIHAPVTLTPTGAWVAGATSVTFTSGLQSYHAGCTVKFGGEPHNEITAVVGQVATVKNPFINAGSGTGIIYQDCVTPASDVIEPERPIAIADGPELVPASHPSAFNSIPAQRDYGRTFRGDYRSQFGRPPMMYDFAEDGEPLIEPQPRFFWIDPVWGGTGTVAANRIRLAPMPSEAQILNYRARLAPPEWTVADIYDAGTPTVDPGTAIPFQAARIIASFLPLARYRFAAMPVMADSKAREQIVEDYKIAFKIEAKVATRNRGLNPTPNPEH